MSQTINQAVHYGSLCLLLGGLTARHQPQVGRSEVRQVTVVGQGGGTATRGASAQRCVLLQPKIRHPFHKLAHAILRAIRGWRQ